MSEFKIVDDWDGNKQTTTGGTHVCAYVPAFAENAEPMLRLTTEDDSGEEVVIPAPVDAVLAVIRANKLDPLAEAAREFVALVDFQANSGRLTDWARYNRVFTRLRGLL